MGPARLAAELRWMPWRDPPNLAALEASRLESILRRAHTNQLTTGAQMRSQESSARLRRIANSMRADAEELIRVAADYDDWADAMDRQAGVPQPPTPAPSRTGEDSAPSDQLPLEAAAARANGNLPGPQLNGHHNGPMGELTPR